MDVRVDHIPNQLDWNNDCTASELGHGNDHDKSTEYAHDARGCLVKLRQQELTYELPRL